MKVTEDRLAEIVNRQAQAKEAKKRESRMAAFRLIRSAPIQSDADNPAEYDPMADPMYDRDYHL